MIRFSITRPVAVTMIYLAAALVGVVAWRNIPVELLPDARLPRLYVRAAWLGATPEVMEALVTSPVEGIAQQVRGVSGVHSSSTTENGVATAEVTVDFVRGTDMNFARLELSERLAALDRDLPPGVRGPTIEQYVPEALRAQQQAFLQYTVSGPYTPEALRAFVEDRIVPDLGQVDGVGNIEISGGRERVLAVKLEPIRIAAFGLRPEDVLSVVEGLDFIGEAGTLDDGRTVRTVTIRHGATSARDIERLILSSGPGGTVRLSDVARVDETYEEPRTFYRINGLPAVTFTVHRKAGSNAITVADLAKARLEALRATSLPGVRLILDQDESRAIRSQLDDLGLRALVSGTVILLVLILFLHSVRSAVVVFATVLFSILIALILLYLAGYTLNVLTLMGLAMGFGLIVDNAIVVLQNIFWRRSLGDRAEDAAARGAKEVTLAVLAATLTTIVVFAPFIYLQGEQRLYYVPLGIAVGCSLLASLLVSFTFIPSAARGVLGRRPMFVAVRAPSATHAAITAADHDLGDGADQSWYVRQYERLIAATLHSPWVPIILALTMLGGSSYLFIAYVKRGAIWRPWWEQESYIDVRIRLPLGAEIQRSDALTREFERKLALMAGVDRFTSIVEPTYASIRVTFPDSLEATGIPAAVKDQLTTFGLQFGGATVRVYGYGPSFYGSAGALPSYTIQVLGYNYEKVKQIADDLGARLRRFPRIREVDTNSSGTWYDADRPRELVLRIRRQLLSLHGLTVGDVVAAVSASVSGETSRNVVQVGGQEMRVSLKVADADSMDVKGLEQLLVRGANGETVRLADVASIEEREVLGRIVREDQRYERMVSYQFRGPDILGDRIRDAVVRTSALPDGYTVVGRRENGWDRAEAQQVYGVLALSLVLILMVTAALFESLRQPLCVLLTVPMALIGVFLLFFATGASFTREAYIGVIMMAGVVVNNAILLIDRINQLRRSAGFALLPAIVRGASQRVQPILMTSTTTVLGLLPLVVFSKSADANIWNAMALVMMGGLLSSTVLVLTVTPALYLLFERGGDCARTAT